MFTIIPEDMNAKMWH